MRLPQTWAPDLWRFTSFESFHSDVVGLLKISDEHFDRALSALSESGGFLGEAGLASLLAELLGQGDHIQVLVHLVTGLSGWRRTFGSQPDEFASEIVARLKRLKGSNKTGNLEGVDLEKVRQRIQRIVTPFPAVERQAKAEILSDRRGHPLGSLQVLCDLRPVFDESREALEGLMPVVTLRIVYGEQIVPITADVRLTENDLTKLCEKAERAKRKLKSLKAFMGKKGVSSPEIDTTLTNNEEEDN